MIPYPKEYSERVANMFDSVSNLPSSSAVIAAAVNPDLKGEDDYAKVVNALGPLADIKDLNFIFGEGLAKLIHDGEFGYFGIDPTVDSKVWKTFPHYSYDIPSQPKVA